MFGIDVNPADIEEGLKSARDFEGKEVEDGQPTWSYQRQVCCRTPQQVQKNMLAILFAARPPARLAAKIDPWIQTALQPGRCFPAGGWVNFS